MKEIDRRDFIKTTGVIAGAVALSGVPGILKARTKSAVAIVKSSIDVGSSLTFDLSVWGDDTAKSMKKLGLMEVTWTPESMAEIESMVRKACKLSGGLPVKKRDTVLIKPNVVQTPHLGFFLMSNYSTPRAMATISDPRVAIATAKIAREQGAKKVIIAESNASNCHSFFQEAGYETGVAALNDKAVEILYLDGTPYKKMKPPKALSLPSYEIFDLVEDVDCMISIAPMKTHMWAGTTMTMKNFIAFPANKVYGSYKSGLPHSNIADVIVDLTAIVKDRVKSNFGIITGIYAGEGLGPLQVVAKPLNTIVAGPDYVAVDAVGTTIMGFDAAAVGHIRQAHEMGLGTMKGIEVVGNAIGDVQFAAKPVPEAARQKGGENNSWESRLGQKLPT
ncbi:MAG: DUF362 domain-containing protein [Syntrophobacterales bacterium]|nr:MAG: DUF362 domain-containing protein [Syntrophobacterales bacterium]